MIVLLYMQASQFHGTSAPKVHWEMPHPSQAKVDAESLTKGAQDYKRHFTLKKRRRYAWTSQQLNELSQLFHSQQFWNEVPPGCRTSPYTALAKALGDLPDARSFVVTASEVLCMPTKHAGTYQPWCVRFGGSQFTFCL